jgi:hypothetical protein
VLHQDEFQSHRAIPSFSSPKRGPEGISKSQKESKKYRAGLEAAWLK